VDDEGLAGELLADGREEEYEVLVDEGRADGLELELIVEGQ